MDFSLFVALHYFLVDIYARYEILVLVPAKLTAESQMAFQCVSYSYIFFQGYDIGSIICTGGKINVRFAGAKK